MNTIITTNQTSELTPAGVMAQAGALANQIAGASAFDDYQTRKAANTRRRQAADLALFADYLRSLGLAAGELGSDPAAWKGITWA